jgi:putative ABC transport system substrate-binding protein
MSAKGWNATRMALMGPGTGGRWLHGGVCSRQLCKTPIWRYGTNRSYRTGLMLVGVCMRRRDFVSMLCGAVLAPPASSLAQQSVRARRIGILIPGEERDALARKRVVALGAGLAERGWIDGRNIAFETRYVAGTVARVPALVSELLRAKVELIVTSGTQLIQGVQSASPIMPIVMAGIGDPVGAGIVKSLSRPGGSTTGLSLIAPELAGKRLELAKEALARLKHVAIIWNPENKSVRLRYNETAAAARKLGIALTSVPVRRRDDIAVGLQKAKSEGAEVLLTSEDALITANRTQVINLALELRLPAISGLRPYADAGALISYGASILDLWQRAAEYVDKILSGVRPADLPVQQPVRFELIINQKTAKMLGIKLPPALLARADEVIE